MKYRDYMMELVDDILSDDNDIYLEARPRDPSRPKVVKYERYYLEDNLMPKINQAFKHPKVIDGIIDATVKFITDNQDKLLTSGPVHIVPFLQKDAKILYDTVGMTEEELTTMIEHVKSEVFSYNFPMETIRPHQFIIIGMLIWGLRHANEDLIESCKYLISLSDYPFIYRKYWKRGVREDIMNYTVEHLGNKSHLRRLGNLLAWLLYHSTVCVGGWKEKLSADRVQDLCFIDFINRVYSQINSAFRKISNSYYENWEKNATEHTPQNITDDGTIITQDNLGSRVATITEATITKFRTNDINRANALNAAERRKVGPDKLVGLLTTIIADKTNRLFRFVESTLLLFISSNPIDDKVGSGAFLTFGLKLYPSLSTSKVPLRQEIDSILDHWVYNILELDKVYTTREASVIGYRRAIYDYMIMMINYYN